MTVAPLSRHSFTLTPLAPIHIGSGEDLDWTRAIPDQERDELIVYDPFKVELGESDLKKLEAAASKRGADAIIGLQQVLSSLRQKLMVGEVCRIGLTSGMAKELRDKLGSNVQTNAMPGYRVASALAIARHALTPEGAPYVPGSSLKGALRTAMVALKDAEKNPGSHDAPRKDEKDPSDDYLGKFDKSLFAQIALSDFLPAEAKPGLITEIRNEKRRPRGERDKGRGVPLRTEVIAPFRPGAFRGEIRILRRGRRVQDHPAPDLAELMCTTHEYHCNLFEYFSRELAQADRHLPDGWAEKMMEMMKQGPTAEKIRKGQGALVRLGKFCSAESKTVEWRRVWIPQAKRYVLHPYTIWLADLGRFRLPLGWALIELGETASDPVREFCKQFALPEPPPPPPPPPPPAPRIVPGNGGGIPHTQMAAMESLHDEGNDFSQMLQNIAKQSKRWSSEERALLDRLYREKLREKLPSHLRQRLDPQIVKPQG